MDSQEFAQERPWIPYQTALCIAEEHGAVAELVSEVELGGDIETKADGRDIAINTASLILWLGY
jgi:hypothetical protein